MSKNNPSNVDEMKSSDATNNSEVPLQTCPSEQSTRDSVDHPRNSDSELSDDESGPILKTKKRVQRFSDSDSDRSKDTNVPLDKNVSQHNFQENSENEDSVTISKSTSNKSRIRKISASDEEASDTEQHISKNINQQLQMKNKSQKLQDKFKTLLNSRGKDHKMDAVSNKENSEDDSNSTEDEMSSIDKIKEKIKKRAASLQMSICDPDTSDDESNQNNKAYKSNKKQKRTKLISPKPKRMSAKQAMESMQKIKSESNRMLREKEVSLPYHRPKALSLQDIMKRRRPAVSADGKAFPIKMNEDQLKQYALLLEKRQKEMIDLCKSDTEEDEPAETNENFNDNVINDTVAGVSGGKIVSQENGEQLIQESIEILPERKEPIHKILSEINTGSSQLNHASDENITAVELTDNEIADSDLKNKCGDVSAEMELVYNDSIEEDKSNDISTANTINVRNGEIEEKSDENKINEEEILLISNDDDCSIDINKEVPVNVNKVEVLCNDKEPKQGQNNSEMESQLISLIYLDSEKIETNNIEDKNFNQDNKVTTRSNEIDKKIVEEVKLTDFPDEDIDIDEINMDEIDSIIENADIIKNTCEGGNSPALVKDIPFLSIKPKLTGAPGMVIDLDGTDPIAPKKLSGVELLKERFIFYSNLKTPEEMDREREKRQKPGTLHLKLKQELEEKIAEQRLLEWSKRLDNDKQQKEINAIESDESVEDDLDKIESKFDENDVKEESSSESEEEPIEDDVFIKDKPTKRNPLVADEAEESDVDETEENIINQETNDDLEGDDEDKSDEESSEEEEQSSESEEEIESQKPKKGRILKAFEDSDDEETPKLNEVEEVDITPVVKNDASNVKTSENPITIQSQSNIFTDSQDDVLQLAQIPKQMSGELFTSLDSANAKSQDSNTKEDELIGTQSFSILNTNNTTKDLDLQFDSSDKLTVISETQSCDDNLDAVVGMCSGSFTQNYVEFQPPTTQSQLSQSQPIGEDLLNMCTGNFYDNQFVTQLEENENSSDDISQESCVPKTPGVHETPCVSKTDENNDKVNKQDEDVLKSVLDELNEPDVESAKPLKFFFDGKKQNKENEPNVTNTQPKKRFIIDSDDETNDNADCNVERKKKKKLKKKRLEERALHISDDEEDEYSELEEDDEYLSDRENEEEKLVEYDSEENEVEVKLQVVKKKKKKASEFFEQEAELTSEDEWVGSGDEDEAGLDRMEREAGDDDTFHQGRLQRELGQIHMRDVLDQDKREVRLIQELLFEDGDLGAGSRQRRFRWRDADGEEASGTVPDEFADTQEEEFESEEQWRKQRHEREMFLRQMKNEGEKEEEDLNVSVSRTSIIKANLTSRTMSSLLEEVNQSKTDVANTFAVPEKKTAKDIPSPKKPFTVFQQSYHGSLLTRGQGALARLAALAAPLVAGEGAPAAGVRPPASSRNFVFATLAPEDKEPKVTKRKAESNVGTPRLVKKMKTEEKQNYFKNSLLDHFKA